jgi:hypothetical protein
MGNGIGGGDVMSNSSASSLEYPSTPARNLTAALRGVRVPDFAEERFFFKNAGLAEKDAERVFVDFPGF